jgi:hypothetical protein
MGSKASKVSSECVAEESKVEEVESEPSPSFQKLVADFQQPKGCRKRTALQHSIPELVRKIETLTRQLHQDTETLDILTDLYEDDKAKDVDITPLNQCLTDALSHLRPGDAILSRGNDRFLTWNKIRHINLASTPKSITTADNKTLTFAQAFYDMSTPWSIVVLPGKIVYRGVTVQGKDLFTLLSEMVNPQMPDFHSIHSVKVAEQVSNVLSSVFPRDVLQYVLTPFIIHPQKWPISFQT